MKICFSTLGCPEWSYSEIISFASDLGFNGVEIRGVQGELYAPSIPEFTPSKVEATKKKLASLSLSIPCLTSACDLNDPEVVASAKAYIDTASLIGTPYIRILGDPTPNPLGDISMKVVLPNLSAIADYAKDKGVMPLIETNGFFAKTRILLALLQEAGKDNVGVLYDIHHPYRFFGESPAYTLKNLGPYIKHVHIKDSVMDGKKVSYRMLGEGTIPVKETIHALEDNGFEGFYSLEWVKRWDLTLEDPDIAFVQFKEFMDTL